MIPTAVTTANCGIVMCFGFRIRILTGSIRNVLNTPFRTRQLNLSNKNTQVSKSDGYINPAPQPKHSKTQFNSLCLQWMAIVATLSLL